MKKKKLFYVLVLILLVVFVGYKLVILNNYKISRVMTSSYKDFLDGLKNKKTISLESKEMTGEAEYVQIDGLHIKNDFPGYKVSVQENEVVDQKNILIENEAGDRSAVIRFGLDTSAKVQVIKSQDEKGNFRTKYLEKKKIEDDLDLFEYLLKIKDKKYNIFTSTKTIKGDYYIHQVMSSYMLGSDVIYFEGDKKGYMTNLEDLGWEAFLFKDGRSYYITFWGADYFSEEKIIEILENALLD